MNEDRLLDIVDDLVTDCFGYDWLDLRDRLQSWMDKHPDKGRALIHFARCLLDEWDA
jgi:hypothetical protein